MIRIQSPLVTVPVSDWLLVNTHECVYGISIQYAVTTSASVTITVQGSVDGSTYTKLMDNDLTVTTNKEGFIHVTTLPVLFIRVSYSGNGLVKIGYIGA